ncbi:MAG: hypothetical protein BZY88_19510 [SAR202 cluster bacterium Io17-Chloro-G9]|nr:MAG: hypothetical protein BZY88_19510 [SAR202 cluster bacterium Io17-Chloro-G9]
MSVALSHCVGAGIQEGIVVGVVGLLLSSFAIGAFTWRRLPASWELRRTLATLLGAAAGGVVAGLGGLSVTMLVAYSRCG